MSERLFINAEAFHKAQEQGRRKLHTMLLLLTFFLLVYMLSVFIAIQSLLYNQAVVQYCVQAGIELILWIIGIFFLWNGNRLGRVYFGCITGCSCYACYFFYQFLQYPMEDVISKCIRLILLIFYICKTLTFILCTFRLYQRPIAIVWESYEKKGEQAEVEDRMLIQHLMEENDQELKKRQSRKKITLKAQHNLRSYTILLTLFLYGSMLLFYFLLFIVRYYFAYDANGIDFVQRYILLSSLFSAFVWSLAAVLLFMYSPAARYALYVALLLEAVRFFTTFSSTYETFTSQKYAMPSFLTLFGIEVIRYIILIRITRRVQKDPFIKAYWKFRRRKH